MNTPFAIRSWQVLALAAGVLGGTGAMLPAADAPASAPAPASQPASAVMQPTMSMWELVHADVVDGQLVLVPAKSEPVNIGNIATMAGVPGGVHVHTFGQDAKAYVVRMLMEGKKDHTQTASLQDTQFRLTDVFQDTETGVWERVFYTDTFAAPPAARVTLVVSRVEKPVGTERPAITETVKLEATSFSEMCAKHPGEVQKYVEPIFKDLDLGGVFFVDVEDARHVFAGDLPPDPAVVAKLQAILPRLDDDALETRKAAARDLAALGDAGAAPVRALDLSKQPLQTRSMLKTYLESLGVGTEDSRLLNPGFLLLCLSLDDKQIPALAKARLEKLRGKPVAVDLAAPVEERRKVVRKMLMDGWTAGQPQTQK